MWDSFGSVHVLIERNYICKIHVWYKIGNTTAIHWLGKENLFIVIIRKIYFSLLLYYLTKFF